MLILYAGSHIEMNEQFSWKDFTGSGKLIDIPDGANVYMTCFSHEQPDTNIFRPNMKNVTFYNCNLDNVIVPQPNNNQIMGGSSRRYKVQNDRQDWLLDNAGNPTMPVDWKIFVKFGLPIPLPKNIPATKSEVAIDLFAIAKSKLPI